MKKKISNLLSQKNKILKVIKSKQSELLLGVLLLIGAGMIVDALSMYATFKPVNTKDYADTSVMILNYSESSGGSGVILRSNIVYSEVLTNKHVCKLVENGGIVRRGDHRTLVAAIKKYPTHDLCLVKVYTNYGVNTKVIDTNLEAFDDAFISGHPSLFPHVLSKGNFSGNEIITLMVGARKCKKEDYEGKYAMYCLFFGLIPEIQNFEATLVTGTILPGSSGSGVFNSKGEIAGLVFAGRGRDLSYAFVVPYQYIVDFLNIEKEIPYTTVSRTIYDDLIQRIFKFNNNCVEKSKGNTGMLKFCNSVQNYMIWER